MASRRCSAPLRVLFFYTQDSRETAFNGVFLNITRFAYCFFTHRIPGKPFFICAFDDPTAFGRSEGAPSTITQYEYYSPFSPDGVPKLFGTPPRIVFYTQDPREFAFHGVFLNITRFAYCFLPHRISGKRHFMVCFRTSHVSRTVFLHTGFPGNPFSYVFLTIAWCARAG